MSQGRFAFVLHSHLPYVLSHGKWPHGTDWLSEAAAETYLPIIRILNELIDEGIKPKLTIGLSPVLCEQLADKDFKVEFVDYLKQKIEAAELDIVEFSRLDQPIMLKNAHFWVDFYNRTHEHFNNVGQDILNEFKKLQDTGVLEIITCGATHGYFPLLSRDESIQTQVKMAVKCHTRHFGKAPRGIWLPECAYRPRYEWKPPVPINGSDDAYMRKGSDEFLSENGLDFFIVDSALLKGGKSTGVYIERFEALKLLWGQFESQYQPSDEKIERTPREPYLVHSAPEGKKPTAVFARDPETGILVWSGEHGYPGDGNYLDFHKKRFPGGHRYWAVTSSKADLADKVVYHHETAMSRIPENSSHFATTVEEILSTYKKKSDKEGILVAPYDAELFGHWWFEGPEFLKAVLKEITLNKDVELTFLSDHLDDTKPRNIIALPEGSWGQGNHHYIWLNKHTEWTWKHIYECEAEMARLAKWRRENTDKIDSELDTIFKQLARELMLMSASDWQFLISTWAAKDYAELRLTEHYHDFKKLSSMAVTKMDGKHISAGDQQYLADCCQRDRLFEDIEVDWFAEVEYTG